MFQVGPELLALLCAAAVLAGFVDAIAGGGGLITVPALLAAGIDPVSALATNKLQGSVGTASATLHYAKAGRIDLKSVLWPLAAVLVGAGLGAFAVTLLSTDLLLLLLPVLLVAIALYFLFGPRASDVDSEARLRPKTYAWVAGAIGFYDGFFGPGTGSFFALSLVVLMSMGLVRATAHTKVLNLASNVVSVAVLATGGHVLWALGAAMAAGQFLGAALGARTALRFGPKLIRPLLVVVSLAMVAKLLAEPDNPLRQTIFG